MNKLILVISALCFSVSANAAILCESLNGGSPYIPATLALAATANSCRNTSVVVTTPQVVTTAIAWPTDRDLVFDKGGYVTFTGAGALTGLKEARPEWFGINTTPGTTDMTAAVQSAINASVNTVTFSPTIYKISSVTISRPLALKGQSNKNLNNISPAGGVAVGLKLSDLPGGTIIYGTSLTLPAFNCEVTLANKSGLVIEGFTFYQEHANYAAPTDYPYVISDENSVSNYWSGVTIKNCLFANSNKGISLTHCERTTITEINADFFRRGIYLALQRDVCNLSKIHIWNFAKSTSSDTFRQSTASDYAIYTEDVDGLFVSDIFVWDRLYGLHFGKTWTTAKGLTLDRVGNALDIVDSRAGFHNSLSQVVINSENRVDATAIPVNIHGTLTTSATIDISGISLWTGGAAGYSNYDSGVVVNQTGLVCLLNDLQIKYAGKQGVLVSVASSVIINNVLFSTYFPNQTGATLETVGIRNESTTARISIGEVITDTSAMRYVYDGFSENVTFKEKENLISPYPYVFTSTGTTLAAGYASGVKSVTITGISIASGFDGAAVVASPLSKVVTGGVYYMGVTYENTSALATNVPTDTRYISLPRVSPNENYIPLKLEMFSGVRTVIVRTVFLGGDLVSGPYARSFSGTVKLYSQFIVKSNSLAVGSANGNGYRVGSSPSSIGMLYGVVSDRFANRTSAVGQPKGWTCTVEGAPGTWVSEGNL